MTTEEDRRKLAAAEIDSLCDLIRIGAELLREGALPNSYAVQDYLKHPTVKKILEYRGERNG